MDRAAGVPPPPRKRRNAAWWLYDRPLYRDWAFWATVGFACVTALAIGTSNQSTAASLPRWLDTLLASITFAVLFGAGPAFLRLLIRRRRSSRGREPTSWPHKGGDATAASGHWAGSETQTSLAKPPPRDATTLSTPHVRVASASPRRHRITPEPERHMESVATPLAWSRLDADGFERLLFDLLRSFPEHHNVQWLSHTRAADRGRDLSMDRLIPLGAGRTRTERVIVQAKHWRAKSVGLPDIAATVAATKVWEPPVVRTLIVATSGRFSADAIAWVERHNETGVAPFVELWPESHLETLLARRPDLVASHGLR